MALTTHTPRLPHRNAAAATGLRPVTGEPSAPQDPTGPPMRKLDVADAQLIGDRDMPDPRGLWVRDLYVDESRRIEAACSASTIQEFIERLGRPAVDWAVWTAKEVTEGAIEALPRFGEGPGERIALRLGVESGTMCILASILGGRGRVIAPAGLADRAARGPGSGRRPPR